MIESYKKNNMHAFSSHPFISCPKDRQGFLWIDETPSKRNIFGIYGLMEPHVKSSICEI
jgi:hypothetical protein